MIGFAAMASTTCRPPNSARSMASCVARVTANDREPGGCHIIELEPFGDFPAVSPGQFAMLSTDDPGFPILPRPFCLLGARGDPIRLEFMIMPVGKGSGMLCCLEVGASCQIVGPMGHGLDEGLPEGRIAAVAGGYGVAPFLFMAEHWQRTADARLADLTVIFGARAAERLSLAERLGQAGCQVDLCTDDGSLGSAGRVDTRLAQLLDEQPCSQVLTCGPDAMMKAVGAVSTRAGVPCRASLESVMGCGYAVCNGCAVGVGDPRDPEGYTYELACREGTIFSEDRLRWNLI
jgi:dihydroorotate dehydrogenase electron transfer subunit